MAGKLEVQDGGECLVTLITCPTEESAKQLASEQAAFRRPTFTRGGTSNRGGGGGNKKKKGKAKGKAKPGKAAANPSAQPQA